MNKFLELRTERKVIFFIGVAKRCLTLINDSKQARIAADALECCWKQLITKKYDGEILYDYLDNEENGLTVFSEMTDDVKEVFAFNCIIDAVAFASKFAFDSQNAKYYPEPIELVDNELVEHFLKCYNACFSDDNLIDEILNILTNDKCNNVPKIKKEIDFLF